VVHPWAIHPGARRSRRSGTSLRTSPCPLGIGTTICRDFIINHTLSRELTVLPCTICRLALATIALTAERWSAGPISPPPSSSYHIYHVTLPLFHTRAFAFISFQCNQGTTASEIIFIRSGSFTHRDNYFSSHFLLSASSSCSVSLPVSQTLFPFQHSHRYILPFAYYNVRSPNALTQNLPRSSYLCAHPHLISRSWPPILHSYHKQKRLFLILIFIFSFSSFASKFPSRLLPFLPSSSHFLHKPSPPILAHPLSPFVFSSAL